MQCSYCSDKYDPFLDISLEIIKADSLYKALEHFTAPELLDGGEKQYNCQQCKQKVRARKQLTVDKAPHVLTIHLKRFSSHLPGQKIDKKIQYGPVLDLNRFMSSPHVSMTIFVIVEVLNARLFRHMKLLFENKMFACFVLVKLHSLFCMFSSQLAKNRAKLMILLQLNKIILFLLPISITIH